MTMPSDTHVAGRTRRSKAFEVSDGSQTVVFQKLLSKGERVEISSGEETIKLDALLLESLSWQRTPAGFGDVFDDISAIETDPVAFADPTGDTGDQIVVSSEYSHAVVSKVETSEGPGVEIGLAEGGSSVTLGVPSLRQLTSVDDTYRFATWFRTPAGPEDTPVEGPH